MDEVGDIKNRLDIVDFISQYVTLKKAGVNHKGLCPFHTEKTPSFMVSPDKQIFKCFGCGEAGDIFGFLMKYEHMEFVEALNMLADRAGVMLERGKSKKEYQIEKDTKSRLYKINKLAAEVYHKILLEHKYAKEARDYLNKRKINQISVKEFKLGYAPLKMVLTEFLKKRGFSEGEIKQAGSPDRFRNRIIFPIFDQMGNVVGFTGRVLNSKDEPKYLNTPENKIFHKSRILYALDKAKGAIKEKKTAILVEGQTDVILSHQVGVKNVVATSGTALTFDHLHILSRYVPTLTFAFDADQAGKKAANKAIQMVIETGINARMIILPDNYKDVGEVVEKDSKLWQKVSQSSIIILDWLFDQSFRSTQNLKDRGLGPVVKKEIAKELLPFIKIIPDKIEQAHYIKLLAKRLEVKESTIIEALERISSVKKNTAQNYQKSISLSIEDHFIGLLITLPSYIPKFINALDYRDFTKDSEAQQIYKFLQSCYTKSACSITEKRCRENKELISCFSKKLSKSLVERVKFLVLDMQARYSNVDQEEIKKDIQETLCRIKHKNKEQIKKDFASQISEAENLGDRDKVKKLLKDLQYAISKKN